MTGETIVHKTELEIQGENFEIFVYCREDGRHVAKTFFDENDIIINDGQSLEEALEKHVKVLPLAVTCRHLRHHVKEFKEIAE